MTLDWSRERDRMLKKAHDEMWGKSKKRKPFSQRTENQAWKLSKGKCMICRKKLNPLSTHYDHKNRKRNWDNSLENCQAICADCHTEKTRTES